MNGWDGTEDLRASPSGIGPIIRRVYHPCSKEDEVCLGSGDGLKDGGGEQVMTGSLKENHG